MMYNILVAFKSIEFSYRSITILFCIGILVSSLEYLVIRKEFATNGIFSWKVFSSRPTYLNHSKFIKRIDFVFDYTGFKMTQIIRIVCASLLLFTHHSTIDLVLILLIAVSSLLLSFRTIIGNDGSDQMNLIICLTLLIVLFANDKIISIIGLGFIAAQSALAYVVAGIAKLLSVKWRSGVAIRQIMNTRTYGQKNVAEYLSRAPKLVNYLLCWTIISFEILFFLVFLLPYPWLLIFIAWGIVFHIYNAIAMGLNSFFWSFLATYPAILFFALQ